MLWSFTQYTRHTESPQQRPSATAVGRPSWPAARNPRPSRLLRTQGFVIQRQPDRQPPPAETAVFVARSHWHPVCSITGYGVEPTDGLRRNHLPTVVGSSTGERLAPARRAGPTEKGTLRGLSLILAVITTAVGGLRGRRLPVGSRQPMAATPHAGLAAYPGADGRRPTDGTPGSSAPTRLAPSAAHVPA